MRQRFNQWYNNHSPLQRVLYWGIINTAYWLAADYLFTFFDESEQLSFIHHLFKALWMGVWFTVIFNWPMVKILFSRKKKQTGNV